MLKTNKTINIDGTSVTDTNDVIGYFHASINEYGEANTSTTIADSDLYTASKKVYKADRLAFYNMIDDLTDNNKE